MLLVAVLQGVLECMEDHVLVCDSAATLLILDEPKEFCKGRGLPVGRKVRTAELLIDTIQDILECLEGSDVSGGTISEVCGWIKDDVNDPMILEGNISSSELCVVVGQTEIWECELLRFGQVAGKSVLGKNQNMICVRNYMYKIQLLLYTALNSYK